jgi:enoyl-CoA hydratase/carnithine racemase
MAAAISAMRALTVAQVHGPCVGGGFVLALCCDLRVAADDAWFSLPEAELGIPLAWSGVPRLVREVGPSRTAELVLTCRRVPAAEAMALGLLTQVVAPAQLESEVDVLVATLLERSHEVIVATKRQVEAAAEALVPTTGDWAGTEELLAALRRLLT